MKQRNEELKKQIDQLGEEHSALELQVSETVALSAKLERVSSENDDLLRQLAQARSNAQGTEQQQQKQSLNLNNQEFLIDKRVISEFLLKYFDSNSSIQIKIQILETLSSILELSA